MVYFPIHIDCLMLSLARSIKRKGQLKLVKWKRGKCENAENVENVNWATVWCRYIVNNIVVIYLNSMLRREHKKWSHSTMADAVCLGVCFASMCVCVYLRIGVSVFAICKCVRIGRHL